MRLLPFASVLALTAVLIAPALAAVPGEIVFYGDEAVRPPTNAERYNPEMAEIEIDGVLFFRIRTAAVGYSVAEREAIVDQRLVEAMATGKIAPVYVDEVRGRPTVYVGKVRIITVYPEDVAAVGGQSDYSIAESWAQGIREGLQKTAPTWIAEPIALYSVTLNGDILFRLADPAGYPSVAERAAAVSGIVAGIADGFDPELVELSHVEGGAAVLYQGDVVVVATPTDARACGAASVEALATAWAENLHRILSMNEGE